MNTTMTKRTNEYAIRITNATHHYHTHVIKAGWFVLEIEPNQQGTEERTWYAIVNHEWFDEFNNSNFSFNAGMSLFKTMRTAKKYAQEQ